MKKYKENIGLAMVIIGLFLAIATADGSKHEILLRLTGVVMFALGAFLAQMFDFQSGGVNHEAKNKDKHLRDRC